LRPMTAADADGVYLTSSEAMPATAEERQQVMSRSAEEVARRKERYLHFLEHDSRGAWVAVDDDRVAGVALALVREGVWVLSLFAVAEEYRNDGLGKELLDRTLLYAEGCRGAMIASSVHPAAMRRYALAGFSLQPTLMAGGKVRRESLPAGLKAREGTAADLELAAKVDRLVRGAPHGPDLEFMLRTGSRLLVAEGSSGQGYAVVRGDLRPSSPPPRQRRPPTSCGPASRRAVVRMSRCNGSRTPRIGRCRWRSALDSRSRLPAPSACAENSAR
jgi:GNAT superfamily N-acetyltransferase